LISVTVSLASSGNIETPIEHVSVGVWSASGRASGTIR
jgi:hypothetical protein